MRLGFDKNAAARFLDERQRGIAVAAELGRLCCKGNIRLNSQLWSRVHDLPLAVLLYIMAGHENEAVKKALSNYLTRLQFIEIEISGHDLIAVGLKPSPEFKKILDQVRAARLDGLVNNRKEELELVRREFVTYA